jgi:hypothetical protein
VKYPSGNLVVGRKNQIFTTPAVIGTGQTYIAAPMAPVFTFGRVGTLPVVKDPLQSRRYFEDDRTVFVQIEIAECINDIRVWGSDGRDCRCWPRSH